MLMAIAMCFSQSIQAQDDSYTMWENIMITPDNAKLAALTKAMRAHNQKYHANGVYKASVFNISSGPNANNLIWSMGPMMYRHMDARPSEGGHDADWSNNVMPNIKKIQTIEYWSAWNADFQNTSMLQSESVTHPILFLRIWEVNPGQGHNLGTFFERVSKAVKALEGEAPWGIYSNDFIQGIDIGRHFATISFWKNWTEFDKGRGNFREAYEKANDNSWQSHLSMRDATFRNWWDEIWVYNKEMSGD